MRTLTLLAAFIFVSGVAAAQGGLGLQGVACIAGSGFYCQNTSYIAATGVVSANLGQATGTDWTSWAVAYAPLGTSVVNGITTAPFMPQAGGLKSGAIANAITLANQGATNIGSTTSGSVWTCYQSGNGITIANTSNCAAGKGLHYAQIATLTATASLTQDQITKQIREKQRVLIAEEISSVAVAVLLFVVFARKRK